MTPLLSLLSVFPPFLPAQCEMSEWSLWGPCSKKKKLCGFRRGSEERTRGVLHAPGGDHAICSDTKEIRRCTVRRVPCPEGELQPPPPWRCDHFCFLPVVQERASGWAKWGDPNSGPHAVQTSARSWQSPRTLCGGSWKLPCLYLSISSEPADVGTGRDLRGQVGVLKGMLRSREV